MQVPNSEAPLISVIIPVYNAEKYLKKCLDTVLSQTYTNIEVILVNDGSSDESGAIIDSYACQDGRIRVIHLSENKGVSYARNRGIDILKGEYTIFVDADDYVESDFLEKLYVNLKENQADISICGVDFVGFPKNNPLWKNNHSCVVSADQAVFFILNNYGFGQEMCNKLFLTILVKKICFIENIYQGEDILFIYQILKYVRYVSYLPEKLYHYIYHEDSSSHKEFSEKQYTKIYVLEYLLQDAYKCYPQLVPRLKRDIIGCNIWFASNVAKSKTINRGQKSYYLKRFQKKVRYFINIKSLTLVKHKRIIIKVFLLYMNSHIFCMLTIAYEKLKECIRKTL